MTPADVATFVGIVLGIISCAVGLMAIWLSLYFYRQGSLLYQKLFAFLSRMESSTSRIETLSKEVEESSKRITGRLLDGVLGQLPTLSNLDKTEEAMVLRIADKVATALGPEHKQEAAALQKNIQEEVVKAFTFVKAQAAPAAVDYDWGPFVRRIDELERKHRFLGLNFLHKTVFASDPTMQEALQYALQNGILVQDTVPNLPGKAYPVRTCKLKRTGDIVIRALSS